MYSETLAALARLDRAVQMPENVTASLNELKLLNEEIKRKLEPLLGTDFNIPTVDIPNLEKLKNHSPPWMEDSQKATASLPVSPEEILRVRNKDLINSNLKIADAITQAIIYQGSVAKRSNRIQIAILVTAILTLLAAIYGLILRLL